MDASEHLTIEDVLCKSSDYLARHRVTNFKTDAEWLIAHALGWQRMQLYLKFNEVLSANSLNSIKKLITLSIIYFGLNILAYNLQKYEGKT